MGERARVQILSEILSFPTIGHVNWTSDFANKDGVKVGDLVSLNSAPPTKWYLSWVREINPNDGWPKYLLESVEDNSFSWWENVGINIYSRERVSERPRWRWTDEQFEFYDLWKEVCYKDNDAYIVLPTLPDFKEDGSVSLGLRIRFGFNSFTKEQTFPKWGEVTKEDMDTFYKKGEKEYEEERD